jgi:hypothetical protein
LLVEALAVMEIPVTVAAAALVAIEIHTLQKRLAVAPRQRIKYCYRVVSATR